MRTYRAIVAVAACVVAVGVGGPAASGQDRRAEPANVVTVEGPGEARAAVGDLIGLPVSFPVVPGAMLSNLRAEVRGDAVRYVTVANTPRTVNGRPVMGAGVLSAFLVASRPGEAVVTLTPVKLDGQAGEPREYRIKVGSHPAR